MSELKTVVCPQSLRMRRRVVSGMCSRGRTARKRRESGYGTHKKARERGGLIQG